MTYHKEGVLHNPAAPPKRFISEILQTFSVRHTAVWVGGHGIAASAPPTRRKRSRQHSACCGKGVAIAAQGYCCADQILEGRTVHDYLPRF